MKKRTGAASVVFILAMSLVSLNYSCDYAFAEKIQGNLVEYTPVHLAIVMDASGSIASPTEDNPSDPDLRSREAAKTLINQLPTKDNKIALFQYSEEVKKTTELTEINSFNNIEKLLDSVSEMTECRGGTHMIDAITDVRKYLDDNSEPGVRNIIFIFSDGAESGVITPETANQENISNAVKESIGDSDVIIYSVAFDYLDADGNHSISGGNGDNQGYGNQILNQYAELTSGKVMITQQNTDFDKEFQKVVEEICNSRHDYIDEFPGDGSEHETIIEINDSVIEADIRIACNDINAIKNGKIRLYDTNGNAVNLDDTSSRIWCNTDKISSNIKILNPTSGRWKLIVSDIISQDSVNVSLIEQYNMSLDTKITYPDAGVHIGDKINIETRLVSDNAPVTNSILYEDPNTEAFLYVCRESELSADIKNIKPSEVSSILSGRPECDMVKLFFDGTCFNTDYTFDKSSDYLISLWVYSDKFYCYEDYKLTVEEDTEESELEPSSPVIKANESPSFGNFKDNYSLDIGEEIRVEDILGSASDNENDVLTLSLGNVSDSSVVDISLSSGVLFVKALKKGDAKVELILSDEINTVSKTLKIQVKASAKEIAVRWGVIGAIIAATAGTFAVFLKKSRRLRTYIYDPKVAIDFDGDGVFTQVNLGTMYDMKLQLRKYNTINMQKLLKLIIAEQESFGTVINPRAKDYINSCDYLTKITITGNRGYNKPDVISVHDKHVGLSDGIYCSYGREINKKISNNMEKELITLCIGEKANGVDVTRMKISFRYGDM